MDDSKQYTVQIKGTAYRFTPIPSDDFERVVMVMNMNASAPKVLKGLTSILKRSAGDDQWDAITDRLIAQELDIEDVTVKLFRKLIERQSKDQAPADAE
jgi:hypothetical protein